MLIRRKCILHPFKMPLQGILKHKHHQFSPLLSAWVQTPNSRCERVVSPILPRFGYKCLPLRNRKSFLSPTTSIPVAELSLSPYVTLTMWLRMCLCSQESAHIGWKVVLSSAVVLHQRLQIYYITTANRLPANVMFTENVRICHGVSSYTSKRPFHLPHLHVNLCLVWWV